MNARIPRKANAKPAAPVEAPSDEALLGGIGDGIAGATAAGGDDDFEEVTAGAAVGQAAPPPASRRPTAMAAAPAPAADEEIEPQLTRRSRLATGDSDFEIPAHLKKPGWDYEFKTIRVLGQDVDGYELAKANDQGWRPVHPKQMPTMVAPGSTATTIDRMGQRLFMRPQHLTDAAKREDYVIAETQKRDKLKSASAVPIPGMAGGKMHAQVDSLEIIGEVGVHRPR